MTLTLFLRVFLELHWEDFQCDIRHPLSSQISRFLLLKQTQLPSAYYHHLLCYYRLHFLIQTPSRLFEREREAIARERITF